ncbi:MAG: endolytic transglycosylase MltG [bacterium]|jgi:UPF0755 protein
MSEKISNKIRSSFYEYIIYYPLTVFILLLALPLLLVLFLKYLIRSTGAPLKSAANLIGFVLTLLLLSGGYFAVQLLTPYDLGEERRSVIIDEDDLFPRISERFRQGGIIQSEFLFKTAAVIGGIDRYISPGRYDFEGKVSLYDVLLKLKRQEVATATVTIPEGSNIYKIGSILSSTLMLDSAAFVNFALDTVKTRRQYQLEGLEGYLFPDSYRFRFGIKPEKVCEVLVREFYARAGRLLDSANNCKLSVRQIVTLASILEAEAVHKEELRLISSVYHNRLRRQMPLQADPTVLYALREPSRSLLYRDLEIDSPYNTYKVRGLPPGPINSPGLAAIEAALNPAESEFLYFVADGSGRHIFSKTLEEHNRAKRRIKALQMKFKQG